MPHFLHLFLCGAGGADLQISENLSGIRIDNWYIEMSRNFQTESRLPDGCRACNDYQRLFQRQLSDNASFGILDK